MKALIENIQHYCLHDGPGTRTTVFFKGCPLRCLWCSNPTTQRMPKELLQKADDCLGCGLCARVCPKGAVAFEPGKTPVIDRERCDDCGLCARECPGRALVMAGTEYTVEEVFDILKGDMLFYRNSGGGVTFSGGEVLSQSAFAVELAERCRRIGINTAMETSGFAPYERLRALADVMDHIFFDVKHLDDEAHRRLTGQPNALILDNIRRLGREKGGSVSIHLRLPLIPGMNDAPEHLERYAAFAAGLEGIADLELLPYHRLGKNKYDMLGRGYVLGDVPPLARDAVAAAVGRVREHAGHVKVLCVA